MKPDDENIIQVIRRFAKKFLKKHGDGQDQSGTDHEALSEFIAEETIKTHNRIALRQTLKKSHSRMKMARRRNMRIRVFIAFLLLTMLLVALFYTMRPKNVLNTSQDQIFAAYFEPYPSLSGQKNGGREVLDVLDKAMMAYEDGRYDLAINAFEQLEKQDSVAGRQPRFYHALSLMASNQNEQAILLLEDMIEEESTLLTQPVEWYLALAYLKGNRIEDAKLLLNSFAKKSTSSFKQAEAASILQELSN